MNLTSLPNSFRKRLSSAHCNTYGNTDGFTLIEILIAITILSFISLGIYQATSNTFKLKNTLMVDGDFYNSIRLAVNLIDRDVSLVYSPKVMAIAKKPQRPGEPQNMLDEFPIPEMMQTSTYWLPVYDMTGLRFSHFIGKSDSLSFVSVSHLRTYQEKPESELVKIKYELRPTPTATNAPANSASRTQVDSKTNTLYKVYDTNIFEDQTQNKTHLHELALLPGIQELKFRYFNKKTSQWVSSWDNSQEPYKNLYPEAVEMVIKVLGPERLQFDGIYLLRLELPMGGVRESI